MTAISETTTTSQVSDIDETNQHPESSNHEKISHSTTLISSSSDSKEPTKKEEPQRFNNQQSREGKGDAKQVERGNSPSTSKKNANSEYKLLCVPIIDTGNNVSAVLQLIFYLSPKSKGRQYQ